MRCGRRVQMRGDTRLVEGQRAVGAGLRQTIGEQQQPIARREDDPSLAEGRTGDDAQRRTRGPEFLDIAARAAQQRGVVAGVGVDERPRPQIQHGDEQRHELAAADVGPQHGVQPAAQVGRREGRCRRDAHRCLQVGHQQRRRRSLARHVGDAEPRVVLVDAPEIVVVAADHPRRLPVPRRRVSREDGQRLGQEAQLDLLGPREFFLLSFDGGLERGALLGTHRPDDAGDDRHQDTELDAVAPDQPGLPAGEQTERFADAEQHQGRHASGDDADQSEGEQQRQIALRLRQRRQASRHDRHGKAHHVAGDRRVDDGDQPRLQDPGPTTGEDHDQGRHRHRDEHRLALEGEHLAQRHAVQYDVGPRRGGPVRRNDKGADIGRCPPLPES